MSKLIRTWLMLISGIVLLGCATGGKNGFIEEGAILLMDCQVIQLFKGNTLMGKGWVVYNRPDGTRIIKLDSGKIIYRKWWISYAGQWCLTTTKGKRSCGSKVYKLGNTYKEFSKGTPYTYEVLSGNPLKMPEN